jgi:hypothetical protein
MVGMKGLEPSRLAARAPKARVYTNFTTSPRQSRRAGFRKFKIFKRTSSLRSPLPLNFASKTITCLAKL